MLTDLSHSTQTNTTTGVGERLCLTCDGAREVLIGNPNSPCAQLVECDDCSDYDPTDCTEEDWL